MTSNNVSTDWLKINNRLTENMLLSKSVMDQTNSFRAMKREFSPRFIRPDEESPATKISSNYTMSLRYGARMDSMNVW